MSSRFMRVLVAAALLFTVGIVGAFGWTIVKVLDLVEQAAEDQVAAQDESTKRVLEDFKDRMADVIHEIGERGTRQRLELAHDHKQILRQLGLDPGAITIGPSPASSSGSDEQAQDERGRRPEPGRKHGRGRDKGGDKPPRDKPKPKETPLVCVRVGPIPKQCVGNP